MNLLEKVLERENLRKAMEDRIKRLSLYLNGWLGYFALADAKKILEDLPLNSGLTTTYWQSQGLISLVQRYAEIRQRWRTAGCGPARPVV